MVKVTVRVAAWPTGVAPKEIEAGETVTMAGCPTLPTRLSAVVCVFVPMVSPEVNWPVTPRVIATVTERLCPGRMILPRSAEVNEKGALSPDPVEITAEALPTLVTLKTFLMAGPPRPPFPIANNVVDKVNRGPGKIP